MAEFPSVCREVFITVVAMAVLATIAVLLRLLAKRWTKTGLKADDIWILLGLASFWAYVGVVVGGLSASETVTARFTQTVIMIFGASITATKISILCLYYRLFATPLFRRATISLGVVCVLWLIAMEIAIILACKHMTVIGDPQAQIYSCYNFEKFLLSANITETILDFAILCLPLRVVSSLQLPSQQKMVLYLTFLVGGFVCITGIVRTVLTYPQTTSASSSKTAFVWTNAQLGTSIVSACLPIYRPLLIQCAAISSSISSSISTYLTPLKSSPPTPPPRDSRTRPRYTTHFAGLHDDQSQSRLTQVTGGVLVTKGGGRGRGGPVVMDPNVPLHSISVRSSIEIV